MSPALPAVFQISSFPRALPRAYALHLEPTVGAPLLRRASSRGPRDVVSWCALARARLRRIAGRSRGLEKQRQGRRSLRADLGR